MAIAIPMVPGELERLLAEDPAMLFTMYELLRERK